MREYEGEVGETRVMVMAMVMVMVTVMVMDELR